MTPHAALSLSRQITAAVWAMPGSGTLLSSLYSSALLDPDTRVYAWPDQGVLRIHPSAERAEMAMVWTSGAQSVRLWVDVEQTVLMPPSGEAPHPAALNTFLSCLSEMAAIGAGLPVPAPQKASHLRLVVDNTQA